MNKNQGKGKKEASPLEARETALKNDLLMEVLQEFGQQLRSKTVKKKHHKILNPGT